MLRYIAKKPNCPNLWPDQSKCPFVINVSDMEKLRRETKYRMVAIGVSAGGFRALGAVLPQLTKDFDLPVVVVQHTDPHADTFLVDYLNLLCPLKVRQACEKDPIAAGAIYFAPPNYHLLVEHDRTFALSIEAPVNFARPSIDVLFETAADVYGAHLVGVVLTGANSDGSQGLKKIKALGGLTVVQDPATAEAVQMPKSAIVAAKVDYILPLLKIGPFLNRLARENHFE
jgi:two-component system chemotaxis response regulator CheB